jgi:hypothetical protein
MVKGVHTVCLWFVAFGLFRLPRLYPKFFFCILNALFNMQWMNSSALQCCLTSTSEGQRWTISCLNMFPFNSWLPFCTHWLRPFGFPINKYSVTNLFFFDYRRLFYDPAWTVPWGMNTHNELFTNCLLILNYKTHHFLYAQTKHFRNTYLFQIWVNFSQRENVW